jgi:response regulator RpfG family c-di-GMP phosphodiesterase
MQILVLDSSKMFLTLLKNGFHDLLKDFNEQKDIQFTHVMSSKEALDALKKDTYEMIISEVNLKESSIPFEGLEFLRSVRKNPIFAVIPFIFVSSETKSSLIKEAFVLGANDYLAKPLDPINFYKLHNVLKRAVNNTKIQTKMIALSEGMDEAVQVVKEREREIILRLAIAASTRDKETGNHIYRVGQYSLALAKTLGLSFHMQETIEKAAPLHDVGKIAIPDAILQKPGKLTDDEYKVMKNHTIYGYKILYNPKMELLKVAADVALSHHENWDGSGYPYGKKGEEIPLAARITTVADVFDALVSRRRYKEAVAIEDTFASMQDESGTAFDPEVINALMESKDKIIEIYQELKDE